MIKKVSHPSFLDPLHPRLLVTPQITYKLVDLIKVSAPTLLTHDFVRRHAEQLRTALFEFQVEEGARKWTIIKRFEDFLQLRANTPYRLLPKMTFPVESAEELDDPILASLLVFLNLFLNELLRNGEALEEGEIRQFLGLHISKKQKELKIYYQCAMLKRAGGRHDESGFRKLLNFFTSWEERFFTVSAEGVSLTEFEGSEELLDSLLFTTTFSFLYGQASTGYPYGVILNSSHRVLHIDAQDVFTFAFFVHFLGKASSYNLNIAPNRYGSFARIRPACDGKYYIDGQDYFSDLCDALLAAEKEIFITGWMISPFFLLKRPDDKEESRLDLVLSKIAKAGVKINIVIYNGPKVALSIDSQFTQDYLSSLSNNIRILMHPNYVLIPFLWSHHEKMVVIDQKMAFMGGLDLGYGRLDSKMHFLTDEQSELWPGVDYCNYRVTDILQPKEYRKCSVNRGNVPRMPWHDIGVRLIGGAVQDLCRHFIQYWNYVNFQLNMNDRELLMYVGLSEADIDAHSHAEELQTKKTLIKRNRSGVRLSTTEESNNFDLDELLGLQAEEEKRRSQSSCHKVAEKEEIEFRSSVYTVEKNDDKQREKEIEFYAAHLQDISKLEALLNKFNPKNLLLHRQGTSFEDVILSESYELSSNRIQRKRTQTHQILRSASMWSLGLQQANTEQSIHNAYLQLIDEAKEFIYIENQFFISVDNKVTDAIRERILRAHNQKERFRVVIILPALPGFQGHPADENAAVFRVQIHLHLKNIKEMYRGLRSIPNIRNYLHFFSLRAHGILNNQPATEIIYVHSKMMIVDDRIALIGSANINDRSLMGCRDTELAVVIEDAQTKEIKVGTQTRIVAQFAHELRKELYMEHFALSASEAQDYLNDDIWESMVEWSAKNHQIYRELFGCYPDNEMDTFESMSKVVEDADPSRYHLLKDIIKGHAIPFQLGFLRKQDLSLHAGQKEYFLPEINFT